MSIRSRVHVFALSAILLAGCSASPPGAATARTAAAGQPEAKRVLATTVTDVLTKVAARPEYDPTKPEGARNPFDRNAAAYIFSATGAVTASGSVGLSQPVTNTVTNYPEIQFRYVTSIKGTPTQNQLPSLDASK